MKTRGYRRIGIVAHTTRTRRHHNSKQASEKANIQSHFLVHLCYIQKLCSFFSFCVEWDEAKGNKKIVEKKKEKKAHWSAVEVISVLTVLVADWQGFCYYLNQHSWEPG